MPSRVCIVTGANTGIGLVTAREMARHGMRVVLACRSVERAEAAAAAIRAEVTDAVLDVVALDLGELASVRKFAEAFLATGRPLQVLINNAGLAGIHGVTPDGFELAFGVNHLGHYLLTRLLLPRIEASAPARIVHVSSKGHYNAPGIDFERLRQPGTSRTGLPEYSVSKLCNVLFSEELARRLDAEKVSSFSLHPGVVATDVWRHAPRFAQPIMKAFMMSSEKGAATTVYCATASELEGRVGGYFDRCAPKVPSRVAQDKTLARELWDRSAAWVGLSP